MATELKETTRQSKRRSKLFVEISIGLVGLYGIFLGSISEFERSHGSDSLKRMESVISVEPIQNEYKDSGKRKTLDWVEILF
ncbi:MAG: hypothetical protein OEY19_13820 [Gammaproteobacteria bacterium]|nr:hypothetical protein [Gammaproteobacteria bacterium]MDH5629663.1 hypothetical protein [Gammaproteobacteria bacterium]